LNAVCDRFERRVGEQGRSGDAGLPLSTMTSPSITQVHLRRLREIWRSALWPCRDAVEVELLAAGWIERREHGEGRETLRVTDSGIAELARTLARNRARRDAHEALVARVALEMHRAGRIVWRGLNARARVGDRWAVAIPDVFSIRHTTVAERLDATVHEIKVRRADLLSDLRHADKGAAYRDLASQCWYVIAEGIAEADEIPAEFGVMVASAARFEAVRAAPMRPHQPPFHLWMALARASAERPDDDAQGWLGEIDDEAAADRDRERDAGAPQP
jgi:hypothetical protein